MLLRLVAPALAAMLMVLPAGAQDWSKCPGADVATPCPEGEVLVPLPTLEPPAAAPGGRFGVPPPPAPTVPIEAATQYYEAETLLAAGEADRARFALDKAIRAFPDYPEALLLRARLNAARGDHHAAVDDLTRYVRLQPEDVAGLYRRSESRLGLGDLRLARDDAEAALRLAPDNPEGLILRAEIRLAQGERSDAIIDAQTYLERLPDDAGAALRGARLFVAATEPLPALEALNRAVAAEGSAAAHLARGSLFASLGNPRDAIADFDAALALEPDLVAALAGRADVRTRLGEPAAAMADLDRAVGLAPSDPAVRRFRIEALTALGDEERLAEEIGEAFERIPGDADLHVARASYLRDQGFYFLALDDIEDALLARPKHGEAWLLRGAIHESLGDQTGALLDYAMVLDVVPDTAASAIRERAERRRAALAPHEDLPPKD